VWIKRVRAFVADDNLLALLGITGLAGLDKLASAVLETSS
jgi:hypothetical protein